MKTLTHDPRSGRSLSTTLAVAFFALSVVVLLLSGGLQVFSNFQTQREAISNKQQIIAQDTSRQVSTFIQEQFSVLETATRLTNLATASEQEQESVLSTLLGQNLAFRQLILLDSSKKELTRVSRLSKVGAGHVTIDDHALVRLWNDGRYVGNVYIEPITNEPMVLMAIADQDILGHFQGILVAEVNLKFMWDLVTKIEIGEQGLAYVVDRQGNLLAFNDIARVLRGDNVSQVQVVEEFINNPAMIPDTTVRAYQGVKGDQVVGSYIPLGAPDWAVVTEMPWGEAYRDVIQGALLSVVIILIVSALAGLLGVFVARRLAVPLVNLTETATQIAGGDRTLQAVVAGPEEIVGLATAFNSMTSQLRDLIGNLEHRVAERTAELEQKADDLAKANQYKSEFLASMSHELRTPLNAILTFNELLAIGTFGPVNEEQVDYLQKSLQSGKHLLSLINDVLDVAKYQSGKMKLFVEDNFDVETEIEEIVASAKAMLKDKPVTLTTEIDTDFPSMTCDKRRIRQVLLNLISNAVKFTERGTITLSARREDGEVLFTVADTGPGIAPEEQHLLFEPFIQTESGIRHAGGTGLGLPISKNLVEAHGGHIWVESAPGIGSKFCVSLPLKPDLVLDKEAQT
ncbi:MAG: sensor histidine kinase [Anaerolineae bacterium]|nr:sensor histidine kinase [Anaerolineae bacterium]